MEHLGVLYERNCAPQLLGEPTSCALDDAGTRQQVVTAHIGRSVEGFHPEGAPVPGRIESPAAITIPVRGRRCYRVAVVFGDYDLAAAVSGRPSATDARLVLGGRPADNLQPCVPCSP